MLLRGRFPVDVSKLRGSLVRYCCLSGTLTLSTDLPGEDSGIEPSLGEDQQLMLFMLFYIFSLSKRGLGLVRLLSTIGTSAEIMRAYYKHALPFLYVFIKYKIL